MDGPRDEWSTALALALLDHAHHDRRAFALLGFDARVKFESVVKAGEPMPENGLFTSCRGGTEISVAVERGLEIIRSHPGALNTADIVLVTDGGAAAATAPQLREQAAQLGITILGLGIGVERSWIEPWCDEVHTVSTLSNVEDAIAEHIFTA